MNDLNETVEAIIAAHFKDEPDEFPHGYSDSLDDAHKALARLGIYNRANTADRVAYLTALHDVVAKRPGMPTNKMGTPVVGDLEKFLASPREICLAIVKAFGKRYGITP